VEEVTENLKNPPFGNTFSRGPIGSIKSECYSSLEIQSEIHPNNFDKMKISSPFFAKTEISQTQRDTLKTIEKIC